MHGSSWSTVARRQFSSTYLDFREKKKNIVYSCTSDHVKANHNLRNLFVCVTIFCVWTGFDFHPHPPPRQPSRNMWHENCKHIDKMTTRGNINSFILTASCKTSWARAWYLFAMEMTVPPLVFEVTQAHLNETKWWERTITIAHWNKRFYNCVERNRWRRCLSECPLL